MNYEELVKSRKNIGDMTKEELFTYCGGLLSEVWDYEKENIDLQNRFNSLMEAHKNSEEENRQLKKRLTTYQILHRDCEVDNLKNISKIERLNNIINGMEKFFQYAYDNEVRPLNDRKVSVWTICLDKLQELKGSDKE